MKSQKKGMVTSIFLTKWLACNFSCQQELSYVYCAGFFLCSPNSKEDINFTFNSPNKILTHVKKWFKSLLNCINAFNQDKYNIKHYSLVIKLLIRYLSKAVINKVVQSVICAQILRFSGCFIQTQWWSSVADHKTHTNNALFYDGKKKMKTFAKTFGRLLNLAIISIWVIKKPKQTKNRTYSCTLKNYVKFKTAEGGHETELNCVLCERLTIQFWK